MKLASPFAFLFRKPSSSAALNPFSSHTQGLATSALSSAKQSVSFKEATTAEMTSAPALPPLSPTAKRLFWVRHGEVINPGGDRPVYYGAMDVPLSPLGKQEATAAGQYLSQFELSHVFSSTLKRAIYGAEQCLQLQKKKDDIKDVVTFAGFKELDRGDWCGKTKEEIGADNMARFDACDESVTPANGESFPALKRRVLDARNKALSRMAPGSMGCVVSHLQVSRCVISDALNIPVEEMVNLKVATASVTCIDYDDDTQTVHFQSFKPDVGLQESIDGAN